MDRRELILARLLAIMETLGITAARGLTSISDNRLPAALLFDGGENADDGDPTVRPTAAPRRVTMSPQILLTEIAPIETVATSLNAYRATFIKAIVTDATLAGLTLMGAGSVRYQGCALALDSARSSRGELTIDFSITYLLRPDEL